MEPLGDGILPAPAALNDQDAKGVSKISPPYRQPTKKGPDGQAVGSPSAGHFLKA